ERPEDQREGPEQRTLGHAARRGVGDLLGLLLGRGDGFPELLGVLRDLPAFAESITASVPISAPL
ncbi:hypothetical protein MKK69_23650, partial [Methylobacterium sp. J-026]|uniref:hypothetical protein n=1 Tax=Methylobacterium sp. J-026 TaxID=2836624 RepID=UPI001FBAF352